MPRPKVPVGSSAKRPCSSASICRAENLSCCATSATEKPSALRALASSSPTPSPASLCSVIFAALQQLEFARTVEAAAQLVGVAGLGSALTGLALHAQRE